MILLVKKNIGLSLCYLLTSSLFKPGFEPANFGLKAVPTPYRWSTNAFSRRKVNKNQYKKRIEQKT